MSGQFRATEPQGYFRELEKRVQRMERRGQASRPADAAHRANVLFSLLPQGNTHVFIEDEMPTPQAEGDIWRDTSLPEPVVRQWDGEDWTKVEQNTALVEAVTTQTRTIEVWQDSPQPPEDDENERPYGSLWEEEDTGRLFYWSRTHWVEIRPGDAVQVNRLRQNIVDARNEIWVTGQELNARLDTAFPDGEFNVADYVDAAMVGAGGNLVTYSDIDAENAPGPAPDSTEGRTDGDVHRNRNSISGEIYAEWALIDGVWAEVNFGDHIMRSLDVGKLTAGTAAIQTAVIQKLWTDVVRSRKITTDMLLVGAGDNLIADPNFEDRDLLAARASRASVPSRWSLVELSGSEGYVLQVSPGSSTTLMMRNVDDVDSEALRLGGDQVIPGDTYRLRVQARNMSSINSGSARLTVRYLNGVTGAVVTANAVPSSYTPLSTSWQWLEYRYTVPDNAVALGMVVQNASNASAGDYQFRRPHMSSLTQPSMIVDGTLHAEVTISGLLQTAASGERAVMNNSGFLHYNANNNIDFSATSAGVYVSGTLEAMAEAGSGVRIQPSSDSEALAKGLITFVTGSPSLSQELNMMMRERSSSARFQIRPPIRSGFGSAPAHAGLIIGTGFQGAGIAALEGEGGRAYAILDGHNSTFIRGGRIYVGTRSYDYSADPDSLIRIANGTVGGEVNNRRHVQVGAGRSDVLEAPDRGLLELSAGWSAVSGDYNSTESLIEVYARDVRTYAESTIHQGITIFEGADVRIGPDANYTGQTILRLSRSAVLDSPAGSTNIDFKSRGNVYLHAGVSGTGNFWGSSTGSVYVHGGNGGFYGASETISNAANVYANTSGRLYRSTSLREAKVAIEPVTDEQWRKVKNIVPVTYYDRRQAELRAELIEGGVNDEDVEALTQQVGFIAEQVEEAGVVGLPIYGEDGALSGLGYERVAALHQPWLLEHDAQIADLLLRVQALEASADKVQG